MSKHKHNLIEALKLYIMLYTYYVRNNEKMQTKIEVIVDKIEKFANLLKKKCWILHEAPWSDNKAFKRMLIMLADLMIYNTNQPILEYKFDTFFSLFMLK